MTTSEVDTTAEIDALSTIGDDGDLSTGGDALGGKPNPGTKRDKRLHENDPKVKNVKTGEEDVESLAGNPKPTIECPPGMEPGPDGGDCVKSQQMTMAPWEGVLVVEGVATGDGREFAPDALTWGELPVPLRWNKEDSHGGEPRTVAVNVGNITEIWRVDNKIYGKGNMDLSTEDGLTVYGKIKGEFLRGVSIDADSIADADVEYIFAEGDDTEKSAEDEFLEMLFMRPEKIIFHGGRIRAATLCDIPAFAEAYIQLVGEQLSDVTVAALAAAATSETMFAAVSPHATATSDGAWDGPANEKKITSPMPAATARAAYAWIDSSAAVDGKYTKASCKFIHHEISADGSVGAANLTACSTGIGVLNGGRGGTTIPAGDKRGVYNHLAKHLRDAGREPPPANFEAVVVMASAVKDEPPHEWFINPHLSLPTGITVTDDGRVYGHAAMWGECHVGVADVCVSPPVEDSHPYFMTGEVVCADGSRVAVGQITLGTGHANLSLGASRAAEHYDDTGTAVADVSVGNDEHGIWVAGAIRPGTDMARIRELRASGQVSGDWRRIGGQLRLIGLLAVNVPGFPVPKIGTRVASGAPLALVAAGRPTMVGHGLTDEDLEKIAMRKMRDTLAKRIGRFRD